MSIKCTGVTGWLIPGEDAAKLGHIRASLRIHAQKLQSTMPDAADAMNAIAEYLERPAKPYYKPVDTVDVTIVTEKNHV
jgi:hypothetical protein